MANNRPAAFDSFEQAFSDHGGSSVRSCECGRVFFNSDGGWTWEPGELEALQANAKATDLPYSVGGVDFEGKNYVVDCDCWIERAKKIIGWVEAHGHQIAEYLTLEKRRKVAAALALPTVTE